MSELNLTGRTLHHFEIRDQLGRGGMAVVYRAHQTNLDRTVALKILPPEMTFDKSYIARFQQEARAAAKLEHAHIMPIYEIGEADGFYYIAMKYIEGETLKDTIDREAPMSISRTLELLEPVGRALDYAHKHGVVHRDIKPSNVMITPEGWVYLTDFGLARANTGDTQGLTQAGTIMGTPEYMSPEQAQGINVGPASDLYSLAIMIYEMLSGGTPFTGDNPQSVLFARVMQPPTPPSTHYGSIPANVEDVVMRSLARSPEARYASAAELFAALRQAAGLGSARRDSSSPSVPPRSADAPFQVPAPSYPPRPASQPSYPPPPGNEPTVRVGSQPSYPPQQPSYPPQQPSYPPQSGYVARPQQGGQVAASYGPAAQQPAYPQQPSYPPAVAAKPKSRKTLWIGLITLLLLIGAGAGAYAVLGGKSSVQAELDRGQQAFDRAGGLADAVAAYTAATQKDGQNFEAYTRLAIAHLMRGNDDQASSAAQQAINLKPDDPAGHIWLSQAFSDQRKTNEALAQAEEAVRLGSNSSLAYMARATARADIATREADQGLIEDALTDANRAIELSSNEPRFEQAMAYSAKGYVLWQQYQLITADDLSAGSELVADGIDSYNRAIGLQEQLPVLHSNLGYFYAQQGDIAQRNSDSNAAANFDKAAAAFDRAIDLDAEYGPAYTGQGWNMTYQRQYQAAIDLFSDALTHDAQDASALYGRGYAREFLGFDQSGDEQSATMQAAAEDYEAALAQAPEYINAYLGAAYLRLTYLNQPDQAADLYKRALEQDNTNVDGLTGLGDVSAAQQYFDEAIDYYDQALAINPAYVWAYLGKSRAQQGKNDLAGARATLEQGLLNVSDANRDALQGELDTLGP